MSNLYKLYVFLHTAPMMFFFICLYIYLYYKLTFVIIYMTRINASSKITRYLFNLINSSWTKFFFSSLFGT